MSQPSAPQPTQVAQSKLNWKNILLILFIGTTIIFAAAAGYYYWQLSSTTTPPATKTPKATSSAKLTPQQPKIATAETADWKTYSNSKLGFSIKYPDNWFYNDAAKYASENCEPGPGIGENTVLFDRKSLKCQGVAHFALWPAEFVVYIAPTEWNPLENIPGEKYTSITIDGEKAVKNFKSADSEGPRCTCTRIYMNHKSKGYYIEFTNKDLQGNYNSLYDTILSTFRFD